jgi:uncharacterized protein (DUF58 family)
MPAALSPHRLIGRWRQRIWRLAPADPGRVVLRHRRIYILPTRRGWALIATLAIMLLTATNYALSLGYAMTFLVTGMFWAALLHAFRNLAGIAISPLATGEAWAGGELPFTLALTNEGNARQGIVVTPREGPAIMLDLPRAATRTVTLALPASRRGRLPLGRVTVSTDFPMGLWRGWAYVHFPLSGVVYPAPETPAPPLPSRRDAPGARPSARAAETDLAGLREYQRGDAPNRIAWKAVARGAGWYTKQFEGAGGEGKLEFIWWDLPATLDNEERLSRIAAWILAAERETRAFTLKLPGFELPEGQGLTQRRTALHALAVFPEAPLP